MEYDSYNREERYLCAHLFRLLHEWVGPSAPEDQFAGFLKKSGLDESSTIELPVGIFFEVALIRDAYFAIKPDVGEFMDHLVSVVARQEKLENFTSFSHLPKVLQDPSQTHPKQIRRKAESEGIQLSEEDSRLYGAVQGMFNAKPDLAITLPGVIIAYEAKFTQPFDPEQTSRTESIAQVWSEVLFEDLGFDNPPDTLVATIGPRRAGPDISWEWLSDRVGEIYPPEDRTYIAMQNAVDLLSDNTAG